MALPTRQHSPVIEFNSSFFSSRSLVADHPALMHKSHAETTETASTIANYKAHLISKLCNIPIVILLLGQLSDTASKILSTCFNWWLIKPCHSSTSFISCRKSCVMGSIQFVSYTTRSSCCAIEQRLSGLCGSLRTIRVSDSEPLTQKPPISTHRRLTNWVHAVRSALFHHRWTSKTRSSRYSGWSARAKRFRYREPLTFSLPFSLSFQGPR